MSRPAGRFTRRDCACTRCGLLLDRFGFTFPCHCEYCAAELEGRPLPGRPSDADYLDALAGALEAYLGVEE